MQIDIDQAIEIYAKACRTRFGRRARRQVLDTAQALRRRGDEAGAAVWERVAIAIDQPDRATDAPARKKS